MYKISVTLGNGRKYAEFVYSLDDLLKRVTYWHNADAKKLIIARLPR